MANTTLSYAGWMFLPNLATSFLQNLWYRITIRAGSPHPHPSSPIFALHRRRIRTVVILSYLAYTLYEAYDSLRLVPTFYEALSLSPSADERAIKSRFRRLAAQHHPDKNVGVGSTDNDEFFNFLKTAQDTLLDGPKRWAYERFGPEVLSWRNCRTVYDYFYTGVQVMVPYYVAGLGLMILLSWLGYIGWGRFWRFMTLPTLLTLELYFLTSSDLPAFVDSSPFPMSLVFHGQGLLPFQILSLARKLSITTSIAIAQLAPPSGTQAFSAHGSFTPQAAQHINRLGQLTALADAEATRLLSLGLSPFRGDGEAVKDLRLKMREWIVLGRIRATAKVREAVGRSSDVTDGGAPRPRYSPKRSETPRELRARVTSSARNGIESASDQQHSYKD